MNKQITRVATNIEWDVDDVRDLRDLPLYMEIPDDIADDQDKISDYLSEQTGVCYHGFLLSPKNKVEATDRGGRFVFPMTEEEVAKKGNEVISELRVSINNDYYYFELDFGWSFVPLSMCNTIVTYLQYLDAGQLSDFVLRFVREEQHKKGQLPIFKKVKFDHERPLRVINYLESDIGEYYRTTLVAHLQNEIVVEMGEFERSFKRVFSEKDPNGAFFLRTLKKSSTICDIFKYLRGSLDSMFVSDLEYLAFTEGCQPIAILYGEFKKGNIKLEYDDALEIVAIKNKQERGD